MEPPAPRNAALIQEMQQAWINESNAPEILPYERELVRDLTKLIELQMDKTDSLPSEQALLRELYTMEVDRIKYILRAYLRARLHKLEGLVSYQLSTPELQQKLSKHELEYAHRYKQAFDSHMLKAFLASLPQQQRRLDEEVMMPRPNLDTFVFARVRVTIGAFQVEEGSVEEVNMQEGDIFMMRYRVLQPLLTQKKVELL